MKTVVVSTSIQAEPLLLEEVKKHLRIGLDETNHDTVLLGLRRAAREFAENYTNRKLLPETWRAYYDDWPDNNEDAFELPYAPLRSVASTGIVFTNSTNDSTTVSSTKWAIDTASKPGRVVLDYNESEWSNDILHNNNPIQIDFACGYLSTQVPQSMKSAMLLIIGHYFENRENSIVGQTIMEIPEGAKALLAPYRVFNF
jgi:uncharacterized phiE125 gp8 family phage protein